MRGLFHPTTDQLDLSSVLNALGDPIRLSILKRIADGGELTCACCTTDQRKKSALSHHFKVLREAGLISVRIEGKQRFLSLRSDDLEARFPGLLNSVLKNISLEEM